MWGFRWGFWRLAVGDRAGWPWRPLREELIGWHTCQDSWRADVASLCLWLAGIIGHRWRLTICHSCDRLSEDHQLPADDWLMFTCLLNWWITNSCLPSIVEVLTMTDSRWMWMNFLHNTALYCMKMSVDILEKNSILHFTCFPGCARSRPCPS